MLSLLRSKKKDIAIGVINAATNAGLEIICLLKYSNIYQTASFCLKKHSFYMNTSVPKENKYICILGLSVNYLFATTPY